MRSDLPKPTVKEFFHVFWKDLGARLSGSLSVPFAFLAVFTSSTRTRPIYGLLAVTGCCASSAWLIYVLHRGAVLLKMEPWREDGKNKT